MPDTVPIAVTVAEYDAVELEKLRASFPEANSGDDGSTIDVRSLDGETIAVIVLMLSREGIAVLTKWLIARVQARKPTTVSAHGIRIEANSVEDIERLAKLVELKPAVEANKKPRKQNSKHGGGER